MSVFSLSVFQCVFLGRCEYGDDGVRGGLRISNDENGSEFFAIMTCVSLSSNGGTLFVFVVSASLSLSLTHCHSVVLCCAH